MLSEEIKKLVNVSEGKVILSEGDVDESYVVMKLDKYLEEKNVVTEEDWCDCEKEEAEEELTNEFLLDKMSADIETIREKEREKKIKLENDILEEKINNEFDYDYGIEKF
jgi:hypothetical protein